MITPLNILLLAVVGEAAVAADILKTGSELGNMTAAGILGVVCIVCVIALCRLYRDKSKETDAIRQIAEKSVEAITKANERTGEQIKLLESMHNDISLCRKLNEIKMQKGQAESQLKTFGSNQ